jgi:hypothetical protein
MLMNGYLGSLVERVLHPTLSVEPRPRTLFEPEPVARRVAEEPPDAGRERDDPVGSSGDAILPRAQPLAGTIRAGDERPRVSVVGPVEPMTPGESTLLLPHQPVKVEAVAGGAMPQPLAAHYGRMAVPAAGDALPTPGAAARIPANIGAEGESPARSRESPPHAVLPRRVVRSETAPPTETVAGARGEPPRELPPVIRVSIGRVDVRASFEAPRAAPPPAAERKPRLSLEDYLKARAGGV